MWPLKKYKCPLIMVKSLHFIWTEFATSRNVRTSTIIFQKLLRKLLGFRKLPSWPKCGYPMSESKYSYKEVTIYIRQNVIKTQKNSTAYTNGKQLIDFPLHDQLNMGDN